MDDFLQRLLTEGHLRDIGEDTARFDALSAAARDLAADLRSSGGHGEIAPFVLVGFDPGTPGSDPAFGRATDAVVAHWSTYGNVFQGDPPRQLLRMVLLEAVRLAAEGDARAAAAAWYTAENTLAAVDPAPGLLVELAREFGVTTERTAAAAWARPEHEPSFRMPPRSKAQAAGLEPLRLRADLVNEAVTNALSENISGLRYRDPRTGVANDPDSWAAASAPKLGAAIVSAVNTALNLVIERVNGAGLLSAEGVKDFAEDVGARVRDALAEAQRAFTAQELRSELLWWRQALYSPVLRRSYRGLAAGHAAVAMAADLHRLVPEFTPQSVEFLLREAVHAAGFSEELTLVDFVEAARDHRDVWAGDYAPPVSGGPRRAQVLTVALEGTADPRVWLGPSATQRLGVGDLAVWAFRELQAARLVAPD